VIRPFRLLRGATKSLSAPLAMSTEADLFDRRLQSALIESRQRYKDLVDIAGDFAWETDAAGLFVFVSPRGALGYAAAELIGQRAASLFADPHDDAALFAAHEPLENLQLWLRHADGTSACLRASAVPILDADGQWHGARGICRDITAARTRDAALARADLRERLLGHILRAMRDSIEPNEILNAAATATARGLGAGTCQVLRGGTPGDFILAAQAGSDAAWQEAPLAEAIAAEGPVTAGPWLVAVTRYRRAVHGAVVLHAFDNRPWDADAVALLGGVADHLGIAIAQIEDHERLRELSRTDGLTHLLNRRTFYDEVERRWRRARVPASMAGALVYCDLDNFKLVNDHAGHGAGDDALRQVARILTELTRGQDLVARLGGDEFALWLEGADRAGAESKAAAILQAVQAFAHLSGDAARPFAVSLGIALADRGDADLDAFFARADGAMYAAKQAGKGQVAFAEPPLPKSVS
jgi:diguanylate cyclase (GGDEF)-like protein/PAS domain S-box-containing protein